MTQEVVMVGLDKIRIDGGTQARAGLNEAVVAEYAELLADGSANMPACIGYFDGTDTWLADGFHRYHAYKRAGRDELPMVVHAGTKRDAVLFAVGANAEHGLRRTTEDKKKAIGVLLADAEWSKGSVEWIAKTAKVGWSLADKTVKEWLAAHSQPEREKVIGSNGREYAAKAEREPKERISTTKHTKAQEKDVPPAREVEEVPVEAPQAADEPNTSDVFLDSKGKPVPSNLSEIFDAAAEFRGMVHHLGVLQSRVKALRATPSGRWLNQSVLTDLENAQRSIRFAAPYVVCPRCDGQGCHDGKHAVCAGAGWIREGHYQQLTDEQKRKCESQKKKAS